MCGRYVIISTPEAIRALFGYGEQPNFPPRYNVAQTQPVPIVRLHDGKRSFALMRWGLLPSWVKDPKTFPLLINARGESVLDKPAFRNAMRRRRCLIPTDGFYEWQLRQHPARRSGRISCAPNVAPTAARHRSPSPARRRARYRRHHHHDGEPHAFGRARAHAGVCCTGSVRPVARLRQCRSRRRRRMRRPTKGCLKSMRSPPP